MRGDDTSHFLEGTPGTASVSPGVRQQPGSARLVTGQWTVPQSPVGGALVSSLVQEEGEPDDARTLVDYRPGT